MPGSVGPEKCFLLAGLQPAERERIYAHLQHVSMPLGKVVYESGDVLRHVYFPADCIISLLYVLQDGSSAEISIVGNEGLVGVALFMGGETTPSRRCSEAGPWRSSAAGGLGISSNSPHQGGLYYLRMVNSAQVGD